MVTADRRAPVRRQINHLETRPSLIFLYSAQEQAMNDRRKRSRAMSSQAAAISWAGARRVNCVVRNFSSTGARLEGALPTSLPESFDLVFDDERSTLACRVKWRRQHAVGVEFAVHRR
jgi:hypothetical protein